MNRKFSQPGQHKVYLLSQTQYIAYGFFISRSGEGASFLDALFTSTSASCVTGLVIADTWSKWSLFGQIVITCLIQIGGLGFVTIGVFFSIVLRRKIGLRQRGLMQESSSALQIGGVVRLARRSVSCRSTDFSAGSITGFSTRFPLSATEDLI